MLARTLRTASECLRTLKPPLRAAASAASRVSVGSELSQGARLVLQSARSGRSSSTSTLISAGTLGAVALGVPDGSTIVWVLDTTTNAPVRGARAPAQKGLRGRGGVHTCNPEAHTTSHP
eukprot:6214231-Pleurochrysis_carterae.AAC.6